MSISGTASTLYQSLLAYNVVLCFACILMIVKRYFCGFLSVSFPSFLPNSRELTKGKGGSLTNRRGCWRGYIPGWFPDRFGKWGKKIMVQFRLFSSCGCVYIYTIAFRNFVFWNVSLFHPNLLPRLSGWIELNYILQNRTTKVAHFFQVRKTLWSASSPFSYDNIPIKIPLLIDTGF